MNISGDHFVASIAARAVSLTNNHPKPKAFSQMRKPIAFDVNRRVRNNMEILSDAFRFSTSMSLSEAEVASNGSSGGNGDPGSIDGYSVRFSLYT